MVATMIRHLGGLYRADIWHATSPRTNIPRPMSGVGVVDALDGAVAGEGDGSAAEVAPDTGPQFQRPGGGGITGGGDGEIGAAGVDVLRLQPYRLGRAPEGSDRGFDVEGGQVDEYVVLG